MVCEQVILLHHVEYMLHDVPFKNKLWDFPGGTVVKNPPTNAGGTSSILVREDPTCRGATKPVHHNY